MAALLFSTVNTLLVFLLLLLLLLLLCRDPDLYTVSSTLPDLGLHRRLQCQLLAQKHL